MNNKIKNIRRFNQQFQALSFSELMRIADAEYLEFVAELDEQGNEIDPRAELVNKILEYKRFKEASAQMAEMEAQRLLMVKRGNIQHELASIGEEASEGTEITQVTLFKLMKAFEKALQKYSDRVNKPVHTVVRYNYTMEGSRKSMLSMAKSEKTLSFEKIFETCENRVHAIFTFLSVLELIQLHYLRILIGEGKNNFIIEYDEEGAAAAAVGTTSSALPLPLAFVDDGRGDADGLKEAWSMGNVVWLPPRFAVVPLYCRAEIGRAHV